ncbi:DUF2231 domain-containing protein [Georgenia sp. SYP-B2076]|uniref:DUF2231 domain-containing protein n=1 Tax=Georgenia sp. SYP-B2076 TaxID=2495881 RepID=UPI000F8CB210|nr:DUF2231 domain-containing protein [Georgenia sp. SYP-B2076]
MLDLVTGLPVHALVVHAVVVLLPLAVAGTIVVVLVPAWRRAYAPLVALVATVATALVPVATESGLALMRRVGPPLAAHQAEGQRLVYFAVPLTVLLWALVVADVGRRRAARAAAPATTEDGGDADAGAAARGAQVRTRLAPRTEPATAPGRRLATVVAVLALVAALATGLQVFRVGESGARSVWGGVGQGDSAPRTSVPAPSGG